MQTSLGAQRMWARRQGLSLEEYLSKINSGLKRCMKCKEWKPTAEFPKDKSRKDGLHTRCKPCQARPLPHKTTTPPSMRKKLSEKMKGTQFRKGIPLTLKHRALLRRIRIEEGQNGNGSFYGKNNPNWKGGITPENVKLRNCADYRIWRDKVFKRDNYTCQICGDNKGSNLNSHHINPWSKNKELRYDVTNGITLCSVCHYKKHDKPDSYRKRRKQKKSLKLF